MTDFKLLLLHDVIGMFLLLVFSLLGLSIAEKTSVKITIGIYVVLQMILYLIDFIFISNL